MGESDKLKLLTPEMVEQKFHIKRGTLANWRCQGRGPEYVKTGRKVLYTLTALEEWSRSCTVRTADSLDSVG
jgi:Helix-turn-helix domain